MFCFLMLEPRKINENNLRDFLFLGVASDILSLITLRICLFGAIFMFFSVKSLGDNAKPVEIFHLR